MSVKLPNIPVKSLSGDEILGADDTPSMESLASELAHRQLSKTLRLIEAKRKTRRQRRLLRESGDYLGVQGINPETGQLDIVTPTDSDKSESCEGIDEKLNSLRNKLAHASSTHGPSQTEQELKQLFHKLEAEKLLRRQRDKAALRSASRAVKWRRHTKQWSSAQEPALSPIAQSHRSVTPTSTERTRASELEMVSNLLNQVDDGPALLLAHGHPQNIVKANLPTIASSRLHTPDTQELGRGTSGSSHTVIRTPGRQSLTNASPAILEKFDNGASAGDSEDASAKEQEQVASQPLLSNSFLDYRISWIPEPRRTMPLPLNTTQQLTQMQPGQPNHMGLQFKDRSTCLQIDNLVRRESFTLGSKTCHRNSETLSAAQKIAQHLDGQPQFAGKLSHRARYPLPPPNKATMPERGPGRGIGEQHYHPECSSARKSGNTRTKQTNGTMWSTEKIQREMKSLRNLVAQIDRPKTPDIQGRPSHCEAGCEWTEDSIHDTIKESASIHTTTTTGSGRMMWLSSHANHMQKAAGDQVRQTEKKAFQVTPSRQDKRSSREIKSPVFLLRSNSSIWPKSAVRGAPAAADATTSVRHLGATKLRTEALTSRFSKPATARAPRALESHNQSSISMFTQHQREHQSDVGAAARVVVSSLQGVWGRAAAKLGSLTKHIPHPGGLEARGTQTRMGMGSCEKRHPMSRKVMYTSTKTAQVPADLPVKTPGSYPNHLDDDSGDIGGLFNGKNRDDIQFEWDWTSVRNLVDTTVLPGTHAGHLWWKQVGPVFDLDSNYWRAKTKYSGCLLDDLVLALAVPGAVVALSALVWGVRIVTAVGMGLGQVVVYAGKKLLFLSG